FQCGTRLPLGPGALPNGEEANGSGGPVSTQGLPVRHEGGGHCCSCATSIPDLGGDAGADKFAFTVFILTAAKSPFHFLVWYVHQQPQFNSASYLAPHSFSLSPTASLFLSPCMHVCVTNQ